MPSIIAALESCAKETGLNELADQTHDLFTDYGDGDFFDELVRPLDGTERRPMGLIRQRLCDMGLDTLNERSQDAENELFNLGITFQVYRE
ncbi:MAG: hypothetical protein AAF414_06080, partial [Pseudomonadota bacterium]